VYTVNDTFGKLLQRGVLTVATTLRKDMYRVVDLQLKTVTRVRSGLKRARRHNAESDENLIERTAKQGLYMIYIVTFSMST